MKVRMQDDFGGRFRIGLILSFIINLIFLTIIADTVHRQIYQTMAPVEITRLVLNPPKTAVKKEIKKPAHMPKPNMQIKPALPKPSLKTPEGAHHHVLTAKTIPGKEEPNGFTALSGGNAPLGKPIERQSPGNAPAPIGPTQDAIPSNQVYPEIPDELKSETYQSFVRVKVDVAANGTFNVTLRTSSGNSEIDQRVLSALKEWRWKPALKNGIPVASAQLFKFEFDVH